MIQRIQTIFLFLAAVLLGLLFQFPVWSGQAVTGDGNVAESVRLDADAIHYVTTLEGSESSEELALLPLILVGITILMTLGAIFLFRNRMLQVKLVRLAMLLDLGLLVSFFFYIDTASDMFRGSITDSTYEVGIYFPMLAMIFLFLGARFIIRDEKLVRSADRLR